MRLLATGSRSPADSRRRRPRRLPRLRTSAGLAKRARSPSAPLPGAVDAKAQDEDPSRRHLPGWTRSGDRIWLSPQAESRYSDGREVRAGGTTSSRGPMTARKGERHVDRPAADSRTRRILDPPAAARGLLQSHHLARAATRPPGDRTRRRRLASAGGIGSQGCRERLARIRALGSGEGRRDRPPPTRACDLSNGGPRGRGEGVSSRLRDPAGTPRFATTSRSAQGLPPVPIVPCGDSSIDRSAGRGVDDDPRCEPKARPAGSRLRLHSWRTTPLVAASAVPAGGGREENGNGDCRE